MFVQTPPQFSQCQLMMEDYFVFKFQNKILIALKCEVISISKTDKEKKLCMWCDGDEKNVLW